MLKLAATLVFIISVASAAGGVLLASKLRNRFRSGLFSALLFYQVFIFTFGFYCLWGQVVITYMLAPYINSVLIEKITVISILLGLPFLLFAWLMLIRFSHDIAGKIFSSTKTILFIVLNFLLIISLGYYVTQSLSSDPASLIKYYYLIMNLFFTMLSLAVMITGKKTRCQVGVVSLRIIAGGIAGALILQYIPLLLYNDQPYLALLFIFLFFSGNAFIPVYLVYGKVFREPAGAGRNESFEEFCLRYEITPRESDIISEICNGLSNKEIADKLFISLQTVKDHSHRIYIKTNVRSRVQLMNLVKGESDQEENSGTQ